MPRTPRPDGYVQHSTMVSQIEASTAAAIRAERQQCINDVCDQCAYGVDLVASGHNWIHEYRSTNGVVTSLHCPASRIHRRVRP